MEPNPTTTPGDAAQAGGPNKPGQEPRRRGLLKAVLSGTLIPADALRAYAPYAAMLVALALVYIANDNRMERLQREKQRLEAQLRELQPELMSFSSALMKLSNQTEIAKLCREKGLGLRENTQPPYKIVLTKKESERLQPGQ